MGKDLRMKSTLTVGAIAHVQRCNGKSTFAAPVAQYIDLTDQDLADFWDWLQENEAVQEAAQEFNAVLAAELIEFGKARNQEA